MYFGIGIIRKLVIPEPDVFIDAKYFVVSSCFLWPCTAEIRQWVLM